MNVRLVLVICVVVVLFIILMIPIVSLVLYDNKTDDITIQNTTNDTRHMCHLYPIECTADTDCLQKCNDNFEMTCQEVYYQDPTTSKRALKGKYCLPEVPKENVCIAENGGIKAWTGWGSTNRMEWDCLCMFPDYFGGEGCTLNPGICELNGKSYFNYDATTMSEAPGPQHCKLPNDLKDNYKVMIRFDGTPIIVEKRLVDTSGDIPNYFYMGYKNT